MRFKNYMNTLLKSIGALITMGLLPLIGYAQTYVTNGTDLQTEVNNASPGEVFIVPNGTYPDFYCTFRANATEANPITVKAESVGGVILTGDSHFVFKKSSHIILEGFVFDCTANNTLVKTEACNNIRITKNVFETVSPGALDWIVLTGYYNDYAFEFLSHHNRIDHNIFKNKDTAGNYITISGTSNSDKTVNQQSQYDRIDHNYFYNIGPRIVNDKEAIRVGNSLVSTSSGYTTVEFNFFEDCDGDPEIVSIKSCDNIVRHNTFYRNYGTLTLRQGNRTTVEGNYFLGGGKENAIFVTEEGKEQTIYTGGVRALGTDHVIKNNYFEGLKGTIFDAPIVLTQGDAIDGVDTNQSLHYRGERITVVNNTLVNNTYGIELGYAKNNGSYDQPLKDITIANNLVVGSENNLVKLHEDPMGEITWINNVMYPKGSAVLNSDGYTFTSNEIAIEDGYLVLSDSIWRATSSTPKRDNGSALTVNEDVEGQFRPELNSSVGADHYSASEMLYEPIGIDDVGPYSDEDIMLSLEFNKLEGDIRIIPNPAYNELQIDSPKHILRVEVYNLLGQKILTKINQMSLNVSSIVNGVYILKIFQEDNSVSTKRFFKR